MGSISRSWDLLGQSFAVLKSDKELMWLPILSAIFCLTATVIILGIGLIWVLPPGVPIPRDPVAQKELSKQMAPFFFLFYIATYSVSSYFNVALVSIASNRLDGGNATLNDGLQVAWMRKWSIFQWALFAATIGMLIQMFDRRAGVLGRIFTRLAGRAWSIASFFVIPLLAAENISPVDALLKSGQIVRKRWGEANCRRPELWNHLRTAGAAGNRFADHGRAPGPTRNDRGLGRDGRLLGASRHHQLRRPRHLRRRPLPLRHGPEGNRRLSPGRPLRRLAAEGAVRSGDRIGSLMRNVQP